MARATPTIIRYKSNGVLLGKSSEGRKVQDAVTGFWTYEDYLTQNDFGDLVDSRGDGLDRRDDPEDLRGVWRSQ